MRMVLYCPRLVNKRYCKRADLTDWFSDVVSTATWCTTMELEKRRDSPNINYPDRLDEKKLILRKKGIIRGVS